MNKSKGRYLLVVIGCALFTAILRFASNSIGLLFAAIIGERGAFTVTDSSLFWTVRMLVNALTAPFVTSLFLKTSHKRFLLFLTVIASGCFLPMFLYSSPWMWMISAFLLGTCNAGQVIILSAILGNWFKVGTGTLLGICNAIAGIASALLCPLISSVIKAASWKAASFTVGVMILVSMLLAALILIPETPELVGLKAYEGNEAKKKTVSDDQPAKREDPLERDRIRSDSAAFRYLIIFIVVLSGVMCAQLCNHMPTYAGDRGFDLSFGAMLTSINSIVSMIAYLIIGYLCDRIGSWKAVMILFLLMGFSMLAPMLTGYSATGLIIASAGLGLSACPFGIFLPRLTESSFKDQFEKAFGKLTLWVNLIGTIFVYMVGVIYKSRAGFPLAFILCAAVCVITLAVAVLAQVTGKRRSA